MGQPLQKIRRAEYLWETLSTSIGHTMKMPLPQIPNPIVDNQVMEQFYAL